MHPVQAIRRWWCGAVLAVVGSLVFATAQAADVFKGRDLYLRHCESCHGGDGRGVLPSAPDFSRGQRLLRSDLDLLRSLRAGKGVMPSYQGILSTNEALDVIAYLRTLQR